MVGTANRSTNAPSDAAVVRVKGPGIPATDKSIVITVDCNSRYVNANPRQGAMIAVAEACRNIVCSGGEPLAVTNNLNFGNPTCRKCTGILWRPCRAWAKPAAGSAPP